MQNVWRKCMTKICMVGGTISLTVPILYMCVRERKWSAGKYDKQINTRTRKRNVKHKNDKNKGNIGNIHAYLYTWQTPNPNFFSGFGKELIFPLSRIFSHVLRDSTPRFVGPSVRRSVRPSVTLYFFCVFTVFGLTAPAQMIWWPQLWPLPTRTRLG